MKDRESKLIKLHQRYLSLIYQINQYQLNGEDPPDDLIKAASDMERIVKLNARARGKFTYAVRLKNNNPEKIL